MDMKHIVKPILTLVILVSLYGCGLRKPLERPDPLFVSPPASERPETTTRTDGAEDAMAEPDNEQQQTPAR